MYVQFTVELCKVVDNVVPAEHRSDVSMLVLKALGDHVENGFRDVEHLFLTDIFLVQLSIFWLFVIVFILLLFFIRSLAI